jgi:putative membrane protein
MLALKGMIVGFGAIMPGISGGTLCVAFGMYQPLIEVFSSPRKHFMKYRVKLGFFLFGVFVGFVGLSGLASWLMKQDSAAVTCAFIGFVIGTLPELWREAGQKGRGRSSYLAMAAGFAAMLGVLLLLKHAQSLQMKPDLWGFLLCGIMWGISFVIPGLSSSALLLFFGLYQPMLDGISRLSPQVLFPLAVGVGICLISLPKVVHAAYQKRHAVISHSVLGIVAATTVMIVPKFPGNAVYIAFYVVCILGGAAASYYIGRVCANLNDAPDPAG